MNTQTKKSSLKPTFKQKLKDKIRILKELQVENIQTISYAEAQFILNTKKFKQNVIKMFLRQMLKDNYERIDRTWYKELSQTKILDDIFAIKRKAIEQQWVTENLKKNIIQEKETKARIYTENAQNNQNAKEKVRALKGELRIISAQIDMSKNQEQSKNLMSKYLALKSEFTFLTNRNRRMKRLNEQRLSMQKNENDEEKIESIQKRMHTLSLQKEREKYMRALCRNAKQSKSPDKQDKEGQIGQNRIKKLEEIFIEFSRKQGKSSMLFDELQSSKETIGLQNFLKMVAQTNIDSHLTLEQRVKIFKQNSNYSRKIQFTNFTNALKEICQKNCEKLSIDFNSKILDIFLDEFVVKVEGNSRLSSYRKNFGSLKQQNLLKGQQLSKYKYKLTCHSGKMPQNIKQDLSARKKVKELKKIRRQGYSYSVSGSPNQYNRINTQKATSTFKDKPTCIDFRARSGRPMITVQTETDIRKETIMSRYALTNNYASIFQKRKQLQNKKRGSYCLTEVEPPKGKYTARKIIQQSEPQSSKTISMKNSIELEPVMNGQNEQDRAMEELIEYEDDDPFLTSHLQKEKVIRWNRNPRAGNSFKIHF